MITHKDIKYVIVQAGGKGTRLGRYTTNRPKCLVPVKGRPMLENTLEIYKDKTVIIIGDTLFGGFRGIKITNLRRFIK